MKGTFGRKHFLHQRWLRSGEDVPHLSLLLDLVPYGILDGTPIELGNLLKFVKAYRHAESCVLGQLPWKGKNIRRDWRGIKTCPFASPQTDLSGGHIDIDVRLYLSGEPRSPVFDPLPRTGGT